MWAAEASSSTDMAVEDFEEEDMQGMVGGIPKGLYKKLELAQKNRNAADAVRKQKEEIAALKLKRAQDQEERIERLKAKRASSSAQAKQEHQAHVQSIGAEVRTMVKEAEAQRKKNDEEYWRQARVRVEIASNLDEKLDASEEAQDQKERQEAADARALLKQRAAKAKEKDDSKKAMLNDKVLKGRMKLDESKETFAAAKREKTQATKDAKQAWNDASNAKKNAHLEASRERARNRAAEKAAAREYNEARMQQRRDAAREEKANDAVATKALDDEVKKNRMKRAKSYKQRYVPTEQAEKLEASDTFRRLYGLPDADGKIKSVSRPLPPLPPPS